MNGIKTKTWQKKALALYEALVYDISFDHISISVGIDEEDQPILYHIQELGYSKCPNCSKVDAPIINLNIDDPSDLVKMCDCGYEADVLRPDLFRAYALIQ